MISIISFSEKSHSVASDIIEAVKKFRLKMKSASIGERRYILRGIIARMGFCKFQNI